MSRHRVVQRHWPSGRMHLYVASYVYYTEGVSPEELRRIVKAVNGHACQEKYRVVVACLIEGDLVTRDKCVLRTWRSLVSWEESTCAIRGELLCSMRVQTYEV